MKKYQLQDYKLDFLNQNFWSQGSKTCNFNKSLR